MTQPNTGVDPVAFVKSRNKHRRHVTASQWAAIEIQLHEWLDRGARSAPGADVKSTKQMADSAGVSPRAIEHANAAHEAVLGDAVRKGKVSAKQAADIAKAAQGKARRSGEGG